MNLQFEFMSKVMHLYTLQKNLGKCLSSKYGQKFLDSTKQVSNEHKKLLQKG